MSLSLQKPKLLPPRILIYGEPKKGKSTFGYQAPNPVFIQTEDGLEAMTDVNAFPIAEKWEDIIKYLAELYNEDHDFNTLVVDSLDWLEALIHKKIEEHYRKPIADVGYQAGYKKAGDYWREYISMINQLREAKNMMIVQIAHSRISAYKSPDSESYDKHLIKMHKDAVGYMKERSDLIIFVDSVLATKTEESFKKGGRKIALGGAERVLYTQDKNTNEAGTRFHNMPQEIPFDKEGQYWNTIMSSIPFFNQTKGE